MQEFRRDENGRVTYTSHPLLRAIVPGQVTWDNAVSRFVNGEWGQGVALTGAMLGEETIAVLSLGDSQAAVAGARAAAPMTRPLSSASQEALRPGGMHAEALRNMANRSPRELQNPIRGAERRIAEHEAKIANPGAYTQRGNPENPANVARAVSDWPKEICNYGAQRDIARDLLDGLL